MNDRTSNHSRFSERIRPLEDRMIRTAWRVLRDADAAEDALQDALTAVWRRLDQVERHPNPDALVLRMCANAAYDSLRRRIRDAHSRNGHSVTEPADKRPGPESELVWLELHDALRHAISTLPRKQGQAIIMRLIQELEYDEIAAALGCGANTARVHVLKGRRKLQQALARFDPSEVSS